MSGPRRVAVVTGAARGIGAVIARRLGADGLDVAVLDVDAAACTDTVEALRAIGARALAVAADVRDEHAVERALSEIDARLGQPEVLVNNAGVFLDRSVQRTTLPDWDAVIDTNLRGAFLTSRAMQPRLKARPGGRIVNIASVAVKGHLGQAAYSAAKAGLVGLTRTLSIEFARLGATVNAVAPGFVLTDMTRAVADRLGRSADALAAETAGANPAGRIATPEDIAHAVAFFVDPRAAYVSGQVLYVAGGPV